MKTNVPTTAIAAKANIHFRNMVDPFQAIDRSLERSKLIVQDRRA